MKNGEAKKKMCSFLGFVILLKNSTGFLLNLKNIKCIKCILLNVEYETSL
jgi:hypothetical protein